MFKTLPQRVAELEGIVHGLRLHQGATMMELELAGYVTGDSHRRAFMHLQEQLKQGRSIEEATASWRAVRGLTIAKNLPGRQV